jgi:thiol:disulfide interchange protein DsbC
MNHFHRLGAAALALVWATSALAFDAAIRKNLADRYPQMPPIDEVARTPMAGVFEVRINGSDIFYTDAEGSYILRGDMIDTRSKRNLTEERVDKLTAIDFADLPLADAITIVRGNGQRKLAVFEDPRCGYCKQFERNLATLNNVTIYMFLYPILGEESVNMSRNIWCSRDRARTWADWMLRDQTPAQARCDTAALDRNVAFGRKYKITGTPTLVFTSGQRVPGAIPAADVEKHLAGAPAAPR